MKTLHKPSFVAGLVLAVFAGGAAFGATTVISDNYTASNVGSGFALGEGLNSGINPPTSTRLTGTVAANLRYLKRGNKNDTAYTIASNKGSVASGSQSGRFTISADGVNPFDFATALGADMATPANPVVYDVAIAMNNKGTSGRMSFALSTVEASAGSWNFGIQIYKSGTAYDVYKRIKTGASGLSTELNSVMITTGTAGSETSFLMRVTDAGAESATLSSRVQLSLDGGTTWFYDTQTDSSLVNGWCLEAGTRYFSWDQAVNDGADIYDTFSVKVYQMVWSGGGTGNNWSTAANWGGYTPSTSLAEDLIFAGSTRLTPNMQADYSARKVLFDSSAGSFVVTATAGKTLTLTGDIFQNSVNPQTLNTPISIAGTHTINTAGGDLAIGGIISGAGGIDKAGGGSLTLGEANTYDGDTSVSAGTLLVNGSIGSGAVSVASGGALGGTGTVGGTVSISGAMSAGVGVGTLTTGALTLNEGSSDIWEISSANGTAGTDWDLVDAGANNVDVQATSGGRFTFKLISVGLDDFDNDAAYSWPAIAGTVLNFAADKFAIDDSGFTNDLAGGTFFIAPGSINVAFANNHPPVADAASYSFARGVAFKPFNIPIASFLAEHTSDADGDARAIVSVTSTNATVNTDASDITISSDNGVAESIQYVIRDVRNYRAGDTVRMATNYIQILRTNSIGAATISNLGGTNMTVSFYGIANYLYVIQRSPDLSTWSDVTTNAAVNGLIQYTEMPPYSPAYYRVRSE